MFDFNDNQVQVLLNALNFNLEENAKLSEEEEEYIEELIFKLEELLEA